MPELPPRTLINTTHSPFDIGGERIQIEQNPQVGSLTDHAGTVSSVDLVRQLIDVVAGLVHQEQHPLAVGAWLGPGDHLGAQDAFAQVRRKGCATGLGSLALELGAFFIRKSDGEAPCPGLDLFHAINHHAAAFTPAALRRERAFGLSRCGMKPPIARPARCTNRLVEADLSTSCALIVATDTGWRTL